MLSISKVNRTMFISDQAIMKLNPGFPWWLFSWLITAVSTGKWKARFDPRLTSRGFFYLDDKHIVDVAMMENAKHPLSLFIDGELDAQVLFLSPDHILPTPYKSVFNSISSCAGRTFPIPERHEPAGGHAFVWPGERVLTCCKAEYLSSLWSSAQGKRCSS